MFRSRRRDKGSRTGPKGGAQLLFRARTRRLAARSVLIAAGAALVAAPAATATSINVIPPVATPSLPVGIPAPNVGAPLRAATRGCRHAGARPGHASSAVLRRALRCLINQQRALSGHRGLRADRRLARAATRHAADMARHNYFGHVSLRGSSPLRRARSAGWRGGVGEALAWGCGTQTTPRAAVVAWMASPPHRAILLGRGRSVGIGMKRGPGCPGGRAYWVAEVG